MQQYHSRAGLAPIFLILIVVGTTVLLGSGVYFGIRQYQSYQSDKQEIARLLEEARGQLSQQGAEIERQRQEISFMNLGNALDNLASQGALKDLQVQMEQQSATLDGQTITAEDLAPYLESVVLIKCKDKIGSGILWQTGDQFNRYKVVTNYHVVSGETGSCNIDVPLRDGGFITSTGYLIQLATLKRQVNNTDLAMLDLDFNDTYNSLVKTNPVPLSDLKYLNREIMANTSGGLNCYFKMPIGSPVAVIGFPAFTVQHIAGNANTYTRAVTNGTISAYDVVSGNYYVTNKIDSGNSGGVALSKSNGKICALGIPTWLNVGNYESQGMILNMLFFSGAWQ